MPAPSLSTRGLTHPCANPPPMQSAGRGRWTPEEDDLLRQAMADREAGGNVKSWKEVAAEYFQGTRSDVQCMHRWQKVRGGEGRGRGGGETSA